MAPERPGDAEIVQKINEGITATTALIQDLRDDLRDRDVAIVEIRTRLKMAISLAKENTRILRSGNGDSVLTRLALISKRLSDLERPAPVPPNTDITRKLVAIISTLAAALVSALAWLLQRGVA